MTQCRSARVVPVKECLGWHSECRTRRIPIRRISTAHRTNKGSRHFEAPLRISQGRFSCACYATLSTLQCCARLRVPFISSSCYLDWQSGPTFVCFQRLYPWSSSVDLGYLPFSPHFASKTHFLERMSLKNLYIFEKSSNFARFCVQS